VQFDETETAILEWALRNAVVLAYAGAWPILARRDAGRGQVFAFAGTVLGEPAPGQNAFWETESWQALWQTICGISRNKQ